MEGIKPTVLRPAGSPGTAKPRTSGLVCILYIRAFCVLGSTPSIALDRAVLGPDKQTAGFQDTGCTVLCRQYVLCLDAC
jgi:hypothetical protein